MLEHLVLERLDHDLGSFRESGPRLVHRHAETGVFHARCAAAETKQAPPPGENVEMGDHLRYPDRIVPRQHDDGGPELDPLRATREVGQRLRRLRRHRIAREMMFERENGVESERLG